MILESSSLKKSLNITPFMLERLDSQRSKIERRSDLSDVERAKRLKVLEVAESPEYKKISESSRGTLTAPTTVTSPHNNKNKGLFT